MENNNKIDLSIYIVNSFLQSEKKNLIVNKLNRIYPEYFCEDTKKKKKRKKVAVKYIRKSKRARMNSLVRMHQQ